MCDDIVYMLYIKKEFDQGYTSYKIIRIFYIINLNITVIFIFFQDDNGGEMEARVNSFYIDAIGESNKLME